MALMIRTLSLIKNLDVQTLMSTSEHLNLIRGSQGRFYLRAGWAWAQGLAPGGASRLGYLLLIKYGKRKKREKKERKMKKKCQNGEKKKQK